MVFASRQKRQKLEKERKNKEQDGGDAAQPEAPPPLPTPPPPASVPVDRKTKRRQGKLTSFTHFIDANLNTLARLDSLLKDDPTPTPTPITFVRPAEWTANDEFAWLKDNLPEVVRAFENYHTKHGGRSPYSAPEGFTPGDPTPSSGREDGGGNPSGAS